MPGIESLLTGRVLADRYRIEEVIGRGGMGAVYRATDERLGRQVAVKVITLSGAADPEARERLRQRFLREARAAAALPHHPNVVPVYDYGTDPTLGLDFLVMELLRGEDLATRLARSGPPPLPLALHVLHEAARAIAVGHRAGLIHRDVKPGNIFLVEDGHGDVQVRVLDFGIAKLADDDTLTQLTQDGRAPLSPAYASPEQLRGLSRITPASDVFSLGAVGFQLLTGERPFSDVDRNRISLGMPVPVPSVRERNPAVPPPVEEVVRRALAFDPAERYPDAGVFARVLEQARREMGEVPLPPYAPGAAGAAAAAAAAVPPRPEPPTGEAGAGADEHTEFLDDRTLLAPETTAPAAAAPAAARTPPPLPPRRPRPERRGGGWLLTALILLLLLGAGGVFAWYTLSERPALTTEIPPPPDELPPIAPAEPEPEPVVSPALEAALANQEGMRLFQEGDFAAAREQFARALELAPEATEYRYNYALALLRLGDDAAAAQQLERVLRQQPTHAGAHFYLGELRLARGDTTGAIAAWETVLQHSTDPRERAITERRLREVRAAVLQPAPPPDTSPPADTLAIEPPPPRMPGVEPPPGRPRVPPGQPGPPR